MLDTWLVSIAQSRPIPLQLLTWRAEEERGIEQFQSLNRAQSLYNAARG